ncbi:bifunctional nitrogenase iron-molybdenum cofactor biosynthesis protein NifEN [Anaeromyxobacter sp. Fw109-5]|uniref:bifunctional nitrogenase iron-molybdenum cofactor biosynthesis protein NifEN n=1 Tax=Anaeromyxobacter sp. (strain Fw109-5) TaxID=404589 RepID=UPI0000ED8B41|nr:bifunctional nitrogenase iron-molybdenum cofactor biosynthesis protein NifEN [Anaeromyxobacter sp. Fw109-5]ABS27224.1 nitrogenase MoFe cofactor biosynthesis protein NifE [Anaeromyxobacter sp. Fw109-5]
MPRPDYYDAPECETQEKGAPKFCRRSEPGEGTERSCAYDGARVVLMPVTDAIHLVHGPIACAGNSWDNRGARSSGSQLYRRGFTTELLENDVVFGGEKKLRRAILDLAARYPEARAVFVYATCVSAMTGDDVEAVCRSVAGEVAIPVVPVNTPGFIGDKNIGNRLAGEVLLEHVIGTAEPATTTPSDVNLIGEYNIAGDLWGMLPLFERLGIRVLSCISGDARFDELRWAHRARLNVIICSKSLTNLARKMKKRWGIPYLEESFYGMTDTAKALRHIARELDLARGDGASVMAEAVEALVAEEEERCRARLAPYRARLEGKRAVLFTGGVKTWSMVNALRELGVEVLAAGTQNSTLEDFHRMKALMHRDARIIEDTSTAGLLEIMREKLPDLVVAGGKTKFLALKTRTPFLDINHGRAHPYAGYEGMVTFARQLDLTVSNPIWSALTAPAPWERSAAGLEAERAAARGHGAALLAEELSASRVKVPAKPATVNPQKNSPALGATLAYLGVDRMLALLHGAQGCSTFIRLQLSRHFKESIALNSTAMSEDAAIFGGWSNLKAGLARVIEKFRPGVVGVMTSGLTETMGDDVRSAIAQFREEHPEHAGVPIVWASTPDYCGSLQEGYAAAVEALVSTLVDGGAPIPGQVTLLPGAHLTPADVEELKGTIEAFGLSVVAVPDVANALDGHIDAEVSPLSTGGAGVDAIRSAGRSVATLYVGDSLARAARSLEEAHGVPAYGFTSLTGIGEVDRLVATLAAISGRPVPGALRRARSRLMDAMVDSHYQLGGKRVALALEADPLKVLTRFLHGMGCEVTAALAATRTRGLHELPAATVAAGDLEDLEGAAEGVDLVVANSNGRQAVARLGVKAHLRAGLPVFDRLGAHQKVWVGYRGTMNLVFEVANLFQASATEAQRLAHN